MRLFGEKNVIREVGPKKFTIHSGWGDRISWSNPKDFTNKPITLSTIYAVDGHLDDIPRVGDMLEGEFEKSCIEFKFIEVTRMHDPPDQFFGKVVPIKQTEKR